MLRNEIFERYIDKKYNDASYEPGCRRFNFVDDGEQAHFSSAYEALVIFFKKKFPRLETIRTRKFEVSHCSNSFIMAFAPVMKR